MCPSSEAQERIVAVQAKLVKGQPMSALPSEADMCSARGDVRYGPKADIASLIRSPHRRAAGEVLAPRDLTTPAARVPWDGGARRRASSNSTIETITRDLAGIIDSGGNLRHEPARL